MANLASPTIKSLPSAPPLAFYPLGKKQPFSVLPGFLLLSLTHTGQHGLLQIFLPSLSLTFHTDISASVEQLQIFTGEPLWPASGGAVSTSLTLILKRERPSGASVAAPPPFQDQTFSSTSESVPWAPQAPGRPLLLSLAIFSPTSTYIWKMKINIHMSTSASSKCFSFSLHSLSLSSYCPPLPHFLNRLFRRKCAKIKTNLRLAVRNPSSRSAFAFSQLPQSCLAAQ